MPLLRGRIIGYDTRRMMFDFTMFTPDAKTMDCSISSSAMDRLIGRSGHTPNEREALFFELRDKIEDIASNMFDRENTSHVRIFSKHVELLIRSEGPRRKR
jgi:hypothetical protein